MSNVLKSNPVDVKLISCKLSYYSIFSVIFLLFLYYFVIFLCHFPIYPLASTLCGTFSDPLLFFLSP